MNNMDLLRRGTPNKDYYSDFTINVRGKIFYVHRACLANRSEKFSSMFNSEMREKINRQMVVDDDPIIYEKFIKILYGWTEYSSETLDELLALEKLADEYLCDKKIIDKIDKEICKQINIFNYQQFMNHHNKHISNCVNKINNILMDESLQKFIYDNFIEQNIETVYGNTEWCIACKFLGFYTKPGGWLGNCHWETSITNPFGDKLKEIEVFGKYREHKKVDNEIWNDIFNRKHVTLKKSIF